MSYKILEWILTDPDTAQYRRRLPDMGGAPVFELAEVHQYGDIFRVGHGRISIAYDLNNEEIDTLCSTYGVTREDYDAEDWYGILAEMAFESSAEEYDTPEVYHNFTAAEKAILGIVNPTNGTAEPDALSPEPNGIQTIGQFCEVLQAQFTSIPDVTSAERTHLALSLLAEFIKKDPILSPVGMCFHLSTRVRGRNHMVLSCDIPPIKGSALEYSVALGPLPQDFTWRGFITTKKTRADNAWTVTPTEDFPNTSLQLILIRQLRLTELMRNAGFDTVRAIGAFFTAHNISEEEQHRLMSMMDFLSCYRPEGHASSIRWTTQMIDPKNRAALLEREHRESRLPSSVDRYLRTEIHYLNGKSHGTK